MSYYYYVFFGSEIHQLYYYLSENLIYVSAYYDKYVLVWWNSLKEQLKLLNALFATMKQNTSAVK